MSNNPSRTTAVICLRLPLNVCQIINRRAGKRQMKPSDYLRKRVIYDTCRVHGKRRNKAS